MIKHQQMMKRFAVAMILVCLEDAAYSNDTQMMMGVRAILPLHFFIILPKLHTQSRPTRYIFACASTIDPARRCDHVCVYNPVTATHQGSGAKINHTDPQTTAIKRRSAGNGDTRQRSHVLCWIKLSESIESKIQ